jgi:hypothetical protein
MRVPYGVFEKARSKNKKLLSISITGSDGDLQADFDDGTSIHVSAN